MRYIILLISILFFWSSTSLSAQESDPPTTAYSYKPLSLKLDDSGHRYIRFIVWHQQWLATNNLASETAETSTTSSIRRSRFLAYAQMSPRVLILTHFGLNGLTSTNMTSLGNNGNSPQLFLHDAWVEFNLSNEDELYVGTGLHYWKGLTRLASASTLNFMTLDQHRPFAPWHSLGVSDQFARHLGIYAKGRFGNFDYRVAVNEAGKNGIMTDYSFPTSPDQSEVVYGGSSLGDPTEGNWLLEGYFNLALADKESIKLPYRVGSYLGKKRVINVGAGFFLHPGGVYNTATDESVNVGHFAADVYVDMPVTQGDCLNAYAAITRFNYGENFVSRWAGTGTNITAQVGYKPRGTKFMPYLAGQYGNYEGLEQNVGGLDIGLNYFIHGHNAKITAEYHQVFNDAREAGLNQDGSPADLAQLRIQAHVFF